MPQVPPKQVVDALVARGVPLHVAQGVAANFMDESGLDTGIQELHPYSGRGGYGLAQWTGPRRIALEDFAKAQGKPINDLDTQLDFFMNENQTTEAPAWRSVMATTNPQDAATAFVNKWERPASKYAAERSARYGGADVAGLTSSDQLHVRHPPNPQAGAGGYSAPGADMTPVTPENAPAASPEAESGGLADNLAALAGVGGGSSAARMAPRVPMTAPTPMPATPLAVAMQSQGGRQDLATVMQRLNSGRLWV